MGQKYLKIILCPKHGFRQHPHTIKYVHGGKEYVSAVINGSKYIHRGGQVIMPTHLTGDISEYFLFNSLAPDLSAADPA